MNNTDNALGGNPEFDRPMRAVEPVVPTGAETGEIALPAPLASDPEILALFVDHSRLTSFRDRAEKAVTQVTHSINNLELANTLLEKIEKSRGLLMAGKENFDEADKILGEVEHRVEFIRRMYRASRTTGAWLFVYELIFFVVLAYLFITINFEPLASTIQSAMPFSSVDLVQFINSLIWGGFGGIVGALYALWKHVAADQDFDSQYYLWYLTNPLLGIALGAFVFLVIQAGFFSLTAGIEQEITIRSALVIYVFAWVSGFKQNVIYEIVRRILDVFRVNPDQTKDTPSEPNQ